MRRWLPLLLIAAGVLVMGAGLMYDVMFAGIPYQDPTPALSAQYAYHAQVASSIRWAGLWVALAGLLLGAAALIRRRLERGAQNAERGA